MNAMRLLFCCAALTIAGCAVDEPVDNGDWVVAEDDVAARLDQIQSHHQDVLDSMSVAEDGSFTSDLGPVDVVEDGDATARKVGEGDDDPDMRWVCWDEVGYRSCCTGNWCCFWDGSQWYCG